MIRPDFCKNLTIAGGLTCTICAHLWHWLVMIPKTTPKIIIQLYVCDKKVPELVKNPIAITKGAGYDEFAHVYAKPWRVISWGSMWWVLKFLMRVDPKIGVSTFPHVSAAQWNSPDIKSIKSCAIMNASTTGSGPRCRAIVSWMSLYQRNIEKLK